MDALEGAGHEARRPERCDGLMIKARQVLTGDAAVLLVVRA
jgi:hypothetical protein